MKKYRFQILMGGLVFLFISIFVFYLFVHTPYQEHQNHLVRVKNQIIKKEKYLDYGNIYEHYGNKTYYLLEARTGTQNVVLAYGEDLEYVDVFKQSVFNKEQLKKEIAIERQINVLDKDISYGYDQGVFMYVIRYKRDSEHLEYMYYRLSDGAFIKSISFGG